MHVVVHVVCCIGMPCLDDQLLKAGNINAGTMLKALSSIQSIATARTSRRAFTLFHDI
jgi:hypothetical protein